jgi:tape measure domain-containing protein
MATERVTRYIRLVIDASGAKSGGREVKRALDDINASTKRTAAAMNNLRNVFAGAFAYLGVRQLADYADTWALITGRLNVATGSAEAAAVAQARLLDIANSARAPLESTAALYARLANATKDLGTSQEDIARATEAVALSFRVGGASSNEAAASAVQLAQGLGSGALQGDELKSVLENNIPLAQVLAKAFDTNVASLRHLGKEGKLTADKVIPAIVASLDQFREQAAQIPETIGGAFTVLKNEFTAFVGTLAQSSGVTDALARGIIFLAKHLDTVAVFLGVLATAAIPAVIAGVRALGVAMLANPIGLLVAAAATAISLLYELTKVSFTFGGETAKLGTVIGVVWDKVVGSLKSVYAFLEKLFGDWTAWLGNLVGNSAISFSDIQGFARDAVNFMIAVGKSFVDVWLGYFRALVAAAIGAFKGIADAASAVGKAVKSALTGDLEGAKAALSGAFDGFDFSGVEAEISATAGRVGENFGRDFVGEAGAKISEGLKGVFAEAALREYVDPIQNIATATTNPVTAATGGGDEKKKGGGRAAKAKSPAEEVASLAKFNTELDRTIELSRMYNSERNIEIELRRMLDELAKAGVKVSAEEAAGLREKIELSQQLAKIQGDVLSASEILFDGFTSFIDGASNAIVEFGRTGKLEMKSLVSDILAQMAKLALNSIFKQLIGGMLGGATGSGFGGTLKGLLGFAQGGDFTVGGGGATDSKVVAFRASPGERVSVTRPDQQPAGSAAPNVKVVNVIDPKQTLDALATSAGERVILNTIERNPGAVKALLSR